MKPNKDKVLARLRRLEGQVRGIAKMVEEDRYCVDVLVQTSAVRSALKAVDKLVVEDHAAHCIEDVIASGDADEQRVKFQELVSLVAKTRD
ncbi:MAG: metal-sensitive transcriptional regulator [Pseudomonadota bacterium]